MASPTDPVTAAAAGESGWIVAIQAVGGATIPEASVTPGHLDALDGSVPSNEFVHHARVSTSNIHDKLIGGCAFKAQGKL